MTARPRISRGYVLLLAGLSVALPRIAAAHPGHAAPPVHVHATSIAMVLAAFAALLVCGLGWILLRRALRRPALHP